MRIRHVDIFQNEVDTVLFELADAHDGPVHFGGFNLRETRVHFVWLQMRDINNTPKGKLSNSAATTKLNLPLSSVTTWRSCENLGAPRDPVLRRISMGMIGLCSNLAPHVSLSRMVGPVYVGW